MSGLWFNLLVVLFFILLGGFFAAAELALISLRESQVQRLGEQGRRGRRLQALAQNPNRLLAAGQVGVTLAGFVSAGFGAAEVAPMISPWLVDLGMSPGVARTVTFIGVTVVIAFVALVLGELVPKRIALQRMESVAMFTATPIYVISRIFRPFIAALSWSTNAVVRILGMDPHEGKEQISGEELRGLVATHEDLTMEERELIEDVFDAGDRELREVMVPRTEVDFLDGSMPVFKAVKFIADRPHSRYPVIRDSADDVIGFVHVRDILAPDLAERSIRVADLARPIAFFPGSKQVLSTLTEMRRLRQHVAIVRDEYGGTDGIITMEDLVEELVGDIEDEYDVTRVDPVAAGGFGISVVDGLINLEDFSDLTGIRLPEGPYETVAGFIVAQLGRVARIGDRVEAGAHGLEVTELDGRRVARVRVEPLPKPPAGDTTQ